MVEHRYTVKGLILMKMLEQKWQQSFHLLCIRPRWWFPCLMLFFLWLSTPAQSSYSIIYAPKWAVNYVAFSQWFGSIFKSAMWNNTNHMKVWKLEHFPIHLNWDLDYSVQYESHQEQQWKTPEEISSNGIPQFFFFLFKWKQGWKLLRVNFATMSS